MEENDGQKKKQNRNTFYTYHGTGRDEADAAGGDAPKGEHGTAQPPDAAASARALTAYDAEFPEPDAGQKRAGRLRTILVTLLAAAALLAAALVAGVLGLGGADMSLAGPQASAQALDARELSFAAVYLSSLPWDRKPHDSLKPLEKMKNIRSALRFFTKYPPAELAAMKAGAVDLSQVAANYEALAGTLAVIEAEVLRVDTVNEGITLGAGEQPILAALAGGTGSASLLITGQPKEPVRQGDTLRFTCLPVYDYLPKEGAGQGGVFFVTIPELVGRVE